MKLQTIGEALKIEGSSYSVVFGPSYKEFSYFRKGILLYSGDVDILIDTLATKDMQCGDICYTSIQKEGSISVVFEVAQDIWDHKHIEFTFYPGYFSVSARVEGCTEGITDIHYFSSGKGLKPQNGRMFIAPRFDWFVGMVQKPIGEDELLSCQQWFSPPPFCYIYTEGTLCSAIGISAQRGEHNFTAFLHKGDDDSFVLQYEGHCRVEGAFVTPRLVFCPEAALWDEALQHYRKILEHEQSIPVIQAKAIPRWWREPIFCGWGEMRYEYRIDHDNHENGNFVNVTDYCMQSRYERYLEALEREGINPGNVIIDMGWAEQVALGKSDPHKWPSLRSFIDKQHSKGRHVLLWYTPMITQGLPIGACLVLNGRPVAPDPTNPVYKDILAEQLRLMLSSDPDCLDADGFKIDFTQNNPSEEGVFTGYLNSFWGLINTSNEKHLYEKRAQRSELIHIHGQGVWGVELLHRYLENIYGGMKAIKADSLLITHTPNPYFADVSDIIRLNDLDGECDNVLEVMSSRAKIARSMNPFWLIDTDNDLMIDKKHWREYMALQPHIGIPDTYYATHIATSCEAFTAEDYALVKRVFEQYRANVD